MEGLFQAEKYAPGDDLIVVLGDSFCGSGEALWVSSGTSGRGLVVAAGLSEGGVEGRNVELEMSTRTVKTGEGSGGTAREGREGIAGTEGGREGRTKGRLPTSKDSLDMDSLDLRGTRALEKFV